MSSIPEPWNKLFKILMLELGEQKNKYNKQHNEYEEYIKTLIKKNKILQKKLEISYLGLTKFKNF